MYGKILIRCDLEVRTGMHIGGSSAFSAIGAVDSPVVRDPYTKPFAVNCCATAFSKCAPLFTSPFLFINSIFVSAG